MCRSGWMALGLKQTNHHLHSAMNPFMLPKIDLEALPPATNRACEVSLVGLDKPGLGDLWFDVEHHREAHNNSFVNTYIYLSHRIRNALNKDTAIFDPFTLTEGLQPGECVESNDFRDCMVHYDVSRADENACRLELATLIDFAAIRNLPGWFWKDVTRTLVVALGVESLDRNYRRLKKVVALEGSAFARGEPFNTERAAKTTGVSWNTMATWQDSEAYRDLLDYWQDRKSGNFRRWMPYPADRWFVGDDVDGQCAFADGVAQRIIDTGASRWRWALVLLIEGFARRNRPPSETLRHAIYAALGLLDEEGKLKPIPLAGVKAHSAFMEAVKCEARWRNGRLTYEKHTGQIAKAGLEPPGRDALSAWRRSNTYQVGLACLAGSA